MKKKRTRGAKRGNKKAWKKPDFEIHSLLDKDLYVRGVACDCFSSDCPSDPGGS